MTDRRREVEDWLTKADGDEKTIAILIQEDGPPWVVCFHAQQMAEKLLKALVAHHRQTMRKVHDLAVLAPLAQILRPFEPGIAGLEDELVLLAQYPVAPRYPSDIPEFTRNQAQAASQAADRVKDFVLTRLG